MTNLTGNTSQAHETLGFVQLLSVTFTGAQGAAGSTLNWNGISDNNSDHMLTDVGNDGILTAALDYWANTGTTYSGYAITGTDGATYGIFDSGVGWFVPIGTDAIDPNTGLGQIIIPPSGASLPFDAAATDTFLCFAEGTCLATPNGDVPVERLVPGDLINRAEGGVTRVRWLGRQTCMPTFGVPDRLQLVRLRMGALGAGRPCRDLRVTADHALLIDGFLVQAGALVGLPGIEREPLVDRAARYTVYHVETDAHEVILAEGTPAETLVDYAGRQAFDNHADRPAPPAPDRALPELRYPRIMSARQLPASIKGRFAGNEVA